MYYHFQQHPFRASANTRKVVLAMMLLSMLFQALIPKGYMPGSLAGEDSFLVICGTNATISFEEAAGLEPGSFSETKPLHADELCAFSGLAQTDSLLLNQTFVDFYLAFVQQDLSFAVVALYTSRNYLLPDKTGPPIV